MANTPTTNKAEDGEIDLDTLEQVAGGAGNVAQKLNPLHSDWAGPVEAPVHAADPGGEGGGLVGEPKSHIGITHGPVIDPFHGQDPIAEPKFPIGTHGPIMEPVHGGTPVGEPKFPIGIGHGPIVEPIHGQDPVGEPKFPIGTHGPIVEPVHGGTPVGEPKFPIGIGHGPVVHDPIGIVDHTTHPVGHVTPKQEPGIIGVVEHAGAKVVETVESTATKVADGIKDVFGKL